MVMGRVILAPLSKPTKVIVELSCVFEPNNVLTVVALKLIYYLGFRRVYLLGCDFDMVFGTPYAFAQQKHKGGCSSNNTCYHIMTKRFEALKEQFEKANFKIINCTPNSGLKLFPTMPYEKAVEKEHKKFSKKPNQVSSFTI